MAKRGPEREEHEGMGGAAKGLHAAMPYVSAVWKLIGGTAVGVMGGMFLDGRLGTTPWMLVGLAAVGTCVGFYAFIRDVLRLGRKG